MPFYRNRHAVLAEFAQEPNGMLKGTFDNAITNAAILHLMLSKKLGKDVIVAFTGDEEESSQGAIQVSRFLKNNAIKVRHIFVLDVSDMGWTENADFTIEDDCWANDNTGKAIIETAKHLPYQWVFVPSDCTDIPQYVPEQVLIHKDAAEDETWTYEEYGFDCCSICLPTSGEMHSNSGVLARENSYRNYINALEQLLKM